MHWNLYITSFNNHRLNTNYFIEVVPAEEATERVTHVLVNMNMAEQVVRPSFLLASQHLPLVFVFQLPSYIAFDNSNIQTIAYLLKHLHVHSTYLPTNMAP